MPGVDVNAFTCPHCSAYANQTWSPVSLLLRPDAFREYGQFKFAKCWHCGNFTVWLYRDLIYPNRGGFEPPNADLPDEVKADYLEAAEIASRSPRGAAALLRLCVQKLCIQFGKPGKNINDDIAALVKDGLTPMIQRALDIVRINGNNAVHPGEIDLSDDLGRVANLAKLVNLIAEYQISAPNRVNEMFDSLPDAQKDQITKRDSTP